MIRLNNTRTRLLLTAALALFVAASVIVIGVIEKNRAASVIADVLGGSTFFSTTLNTVGDAITPGFLIIYGLAFVSGMVAAVNPCGFAMLPAYLSLYLSDNQKRRRAKPLRQVGRALLVSVVIGLGFAALFGAFAALFAGVSAGTSLITDAFPWIGLSLGMLMIFVGVYVLLGGKIYAAAAQRYAGRVGGGSQIGLRAYFLFGLSYALASLSCTLPLFLATVTNALGTGGFVGVVITFSAYALGMTLVITALTVSLAVFKTALAGLLYRILPAVNIIAALIIVLAGCYLTLYWLVEGNLICIENGGLRIDCGVIVN